MAGLLQRAWDWLAPPEVPLVDGQLVKRQRRGQAAVSGVNDGVADRELPRAEQLPIAKPIPVSIAERPAAFCHPHASHQLQLIDCKIGYLLERSRRRTIGMTVCRQGLRVRAPIGVSLGAVERVLQDKAAWIVRKLAEQQRIQHALIEWGAQAQLPYLGCFLSLQLQEAGRTTVQAAQGQLQLSLPAGASTAQVRSAVQSWWLATARSHFTERLNHFAPLLGVRWRSLALSSARTRWGSARSDGSIRLNWRLLHYAPEVIDYVVVHELSHLQHMDHSPRFWATVASVLPDYRRLRQQLRDQPAPRWSDDDA